MGFDLGKLWQEIWSASSLQQAFSNPIWSALIIVSVILVIIYWTFRDTFDDDNDENVSFWRLLFRAGIYISIVTFGMLFIHYQTVVKGFDKKQDDTLISNTVANTVGVTKPTTEGVLAQPPLVTTTVGQGEPSTMSILRPQPTFKTTSDYIVLKAAPSKIT